jgi:Fe-S oxidoreductase
MALFGFGRSDNLYFPGCFSSAFLEKKVENYRKILKKLDIDFKIQKDFLCCGGFFDESGYEKQLRKSARDNNESFSKEGFKKIIVNCSLCFNTFKSYKTLIPIFDFEVEHILSTILNQLHVNKEAIKNYVAEDLVYYDSCYLARYSGMTKQPREILQLMGYKVIELPKNHEETICCGSCGGLPITNPELANAIAQKFIKTLVRKGIRRLVTADARDYKHLADNIKELNLTPEQFEVIEISDLICEGLGIKKE